MTALIPPAAYKSSIWVSDAGASLQRLGTLADISFIISRFIGNFASFAIAVKCRTLFVEHPRAISTVKAFFIASSVIISLGFISFSKRFITAIPAYLASLILSE